MDTFIKVKQYIYTFNGVHADLFVVLLKSCHVLAGLGELSLFHTFSDVPVDEGSLGVHEVELVIEPGPSFGDGCGVGQHADGSGDLGGITSGNDSWWLKVKKLFCQIIFN